VAWWGGLVGTLRRGGRHLPKLLWLFLLAPGLASEVARRRVRYVHANFGSYQAYVAWLIHRLTDTPFGFTVHAQDIFVNRFMMAEKASEASILASISEYNIRFLEQQEGVRGPQVVLVRCGVDLDEFPFREAGNVTLPLRIFSVGRFSEKKGLIHLVRACAALRPGLDYHLDLIGKGEEEENLRREVQRLGLEERVAMRSGVSQQELLAAYRRADVLVAPCQRARNGDLDGIPATLMEAMALGIPVVTTSVSGIPELVEHDRTGLIVPPEDPPSIARALERLVDEPGLAPRLSRAARRRIEEDYDIRRNARRMGKLIRAAVGARGA
jgi:glycosyltransferase involved in cell wall biosynthesis